MELWRLSNVIKVIQPDQKIILSHAVLNIRDTISKENVISSVIFHVIDKYKIGIFNCL